MSDPEVKPVLTGLVALVAVAAVIGAVAAVAALAGTRMVGLTGESSVGTGEAAAEETLFLPPLQPTERESGPLVTLVPSDTGEPVFTPSDEPSESPSASKDAKEQIVLSAGQTQVAPMERINLTGVYKGGEGATLQVQRFENGQWVGFYSVTATVSNETFATYVETSRTGVQRFRMFDPATQRASNEVKITVG